MFRLVVLVMVCISAIGAGKTWEDGIAGFIAEMGDAVFAPPNKEVGKWVLFSVFFLFIFSGSRVSNWSPSDSVNPEELGSYVEGDILMPASSRTLTRNGLKAATARWKDGVVPYRISDSFSKFF